MADVGDQPGALPLLQYALTELFDANVSGLIRSRVVRRHRRADRCAGDARRADLSRR